MNSYKINAPSALCGNDRFLIRREEFTPSYLKTFEAGHLKDKVEEALESLRCCTLCPRDCAIDRWERFAVCKSARYARVSSHFPHLGEEDVLRGWRGSGTIFFSWCNLRCVFCQNFDISQTGEGREVTARQLAEMMMDLQKMGCHNINFVTPEHVVPQILEALPYAIEGGLRLPLVYNTSAYDSLHSIRLMEGVVDIYMPDFKLWDTEHARTYLLAPDYPATVRDAIRAMHSQVGDLKVDEEGIALRGVLVRHLVMPGMLEDTREIMSFLATRVSRDTYLNIMDQYRPAWKVTGDEKYASINRPVSHGELEEAYRIAEQFGLWRLDTRWRMRRGVSPLFDI